MINFIRQPKWRLWYIARSRYQWEQVWESNSHETRTTPVVGRECECFEGERGSVDREDHSGVPLWRRGGSRQEHSPSRGVCGGVSCV